MYGLPPQSFKATLMTSASVIVLMVATPPTLPTDSWDERTPEQIAYDVVVKGHNTFGDDQ